MMRDSPALLKATVEVRWPRPRAALVVLAGEHDLYSADEVRHALDQSLNDCGRLIVDLSAAESIDSTILAVLVEAMQNASDRERRFNVVLGTAPVVERILELAGVLPLLNVVPTLEQALAANEVLFREVNERIHHLIQETGGAHEENEFVCECASLGCTETIRMPVSEYKAVRESPRQFLVAFGHEQEAPYRVVRVGTGFLVVEREQGYGVEPKADERPVRATLRELRSQCRVTRNNGRYP